MLILGDPLAFTVALVTFVTSHVPYLGAIFSGAFAFLVALGASGLTEATILLIVILVVQNVVQTVMTTTRSADRAALLEAHTWRQFEIFGHSVSDSRNLDTAFVHTHTMQDVGQSPERNR
jgi:hypothetical protein